MNREIKFRGRAWHPNDPRWIYGYYAALPSGDVPCIFDSDPQFRVWTPVHPETVGQFTGIYDCKRTEEYPQGQPIYEGDILRDEQGVGEVKWMPEHCAFLVHTVAPHQYHHLESDGQLKDTEIVGNLIEHPDLLRGEAAKSNG